MRALNFMQVASKSVVDGSFTREALTARMSNDGFDRRLVNQTSRTAKGQSREHVTQFANIAIPIQFGQSINCAFRQVRRGINLLDQMARNLGEIRALTQGRQRYL